MCWEFYHHSDKVEDLRFIPELKEMLPLDAFILFESIALNYIEKNIDQAESEEDYNRARDSVPWDDLKKQFPPEDSFKDSVSLKIIAIGEPYTSLENRKEVMGVNFSYANNANAFDFGTRSSAQPKENNKKKLAEDLYLILET